MNRSTNGISAAGLMDFPREKVNPFVGKTIVVTGKLKYFTRAAIHAKIKTLGAKPVKMVSRNTDYLICGEKPGSKLDKALLLGTKILTEEEFLRMARWLRGGTP